MQSFFSKFPERKDDFNAGVLNLEYDTYFEKGRNVLYKKIDSSRVELVRLYAPSLIEQIFQEKKESVSCDDMFRAKILTSRTRQLGREVALVTPLEDLDAQVKSV